jgi:hypothetical protein
MSTPVDTPPSDHSGASGLKRRWLLNAGLLVLIAVLVVVAFYLPGRKKPEPGPPLTAVAVDGVARVRIEKPGQPGIVLEKSGDAWRLAAPVKARANRFNVERLLRVLAAPGDTRIPAEPAGLSRFGLDKPAVRVWFDDQEIDFGALHPLKNEVYVLYHNEVVLIPGHYLAASTYPYTNFIDSGLFDDGFKLSAIKLPDFALALKDGVWRRQPEDRKLTTDRVNDFAAEWQNARALTVDKYSGKEAIGAIEVTATRDGKTENLKLGILSYKPEFVLHRPDENLEYHFTEDTGKHLLTLTGKD